MRRPAAGRKERDELISGKTKQNAVKSMVLTDAEGRMLFCSPVRPGSCADITQARQPGPAQLLADGPFLEILADAGCQGMGAQTGGRVVTPPHRKFKKNAPAGTRKGTNYSARRTLLTAYPRRARHCTPEKLAGSRPPPWPTRTHE
ncbi:transposase family protein [Streptomyces sp. NPDC051207]|uniref:transposase family protein n=1 Tax=Streptomyces sp. NPDC051207 TaxID=3154641 RepID=UPI003447F54C